MLAGVTPKPVGIRCRLYSFRPRALLPGSRFAHTFSFCCGSTNGLVSFPVPAGLKAGLCAVKAPGEAWRALPERRCKNLGIPAPLSRRGWRLLLTGLAATGLWSLAPRPARQRGELSLRLS